MAGFLKNALLSLVMDKKAREKAERLAAAKKARTADNPADKPAATRGPRPMTPEREALIRQAREIQRSKAHILDELPAETRGKLFAMALIAMGGEDTEGGDGDKPGKDDGT